MPLSAADGKWLSATGLQSMPHILSTIAGDRVARLQRRIADGSYNIDSRILAESLASIDDAPNGKASCKTVDPTIRAAAVAMLQTALMAISDRAAMILQLHFVEQLCDAETANVIGLPEKTASQERRLALHRLHVIIAVD